MRYYRFEWDEYNIEHIARHNVDVEEVEDVFGNPYILHRVNKTRYIVFGQSDEGRYLLIVVERKEGFIRVVTARDMSNTERRFFKGGKK